MCKTFPGISTDEGTILTPNGEFYKFEINLNNTRTELDEFYRLENITASKEIN